MQKFMISNITDKEGNKKDPFEVLEKDVTLVHLVQIGYSAKMFYSEGENTRLLTTSTVEDIFVGNEQVVIETLNTVYTLDIVRESEVMF